MEFHSHQALDGGPSSACHHHRFGSHWTLLLDHLSRNVPWRRAEIREKKTNNLSFAEAVDPDVDKGDNTSLWLSEAQVLLKGAY